MTRMQQLDASGKAAALPPLGLAGHLVSYLFDAGPVGHGAMGPTPISHTELAAWQHNTGVNLAAWEARALRRLSHDYLAASQDAQDPDCPPFYVDLPPTDERAHIALGVRAILGGRTTPQKAH